MNYIIIFIEHLIKPFLEWAKPNFRKLDKVLSIVISRWDAWQKGMIILLIIILTKTACLLLGKLAAPGDCFKVLHHSGALFESSNLLLLRCP